MYALKVHSDDMPYQCPHCPKRFKWRENLDYHVATHNVSKQIQLRFWHKRSHNFCVADSARTTICLCILWYEISTGGSLQVCLNRFRWHAKHTLPRFSFKWVKHLDLRRVVFTLHFRTHERRHRENTKTESCPFCTATFEHKFHLKQHIKRKHNAEMPAGARDNVELKQQQNSASSDKKRLRKS